MGWGDTDGCAVGLLLGWPDGSGERYCDGKLDGGKVGFSVGCLVTLTVGCLVGDCVCVEVALIVC